MRQEFDKDGLIALIQSGNIQSAKATVMSIYEYHAAEQACFGVFESGENPSTELIEAALQKFMDTHKNCTFKPNHGYWVHSLSHFTEHLWHLRLTDWIKKFNEVAFNGAVEFRDSNCSDRLVGDFANYAKWDDNPADFYLTPVSVRWMNWEYAGYAKARIEHGVFSSEADFLCWKLSLPKESRPRSYGHGDFGASDAVRLKELGGDVSKFAGSIVEQLKKELASREASLAKAQKQVDENRAAIANLS